MIETKSMGLTMYKKVSVDDLSNYENNSRTHSDDQIEQLVRSIKEYGFTNPILIDENNLLIAGHARLQASKKMGLKEVPCIILNGLTEVQKKAYVIADNKLALNAGWNIEILKSELESLKLDDFDLELTGFNNDELNEILEYKLEDEEQNIEGESYNQVFEIVVECESEEDQESMYKKLTEQGRKCRILSM